MEAALDSFVMHSNEFYYYALNSTVNAKVKVLSSILLHCLSLC